jgi:hypothetical protein
MSNFGTTDPVIQIAGNFVTGQKILRGLGERDTIQTTVTGEDLWRGNELSNTPASLASTTNIPIPADAGEQMSVISEDANDTSAGSGVQTLTVSYLDAAGAEQTTTVTMNGTTAVPLTPTDVRFVQDLQSLTVGTGGVADGNIRIYKTSDATLVYSMIATGGNQSLVPSKMVPAGKTLILREWVASESSTNKRCRVRLRADCNNEVPPVRQAGVFLFKSVMALDGSGVQMPLAYTVPELSIVKASAWALSAGSEVSVHWWGVLIDD